MGNLCNSRSIPQRRYGSFCVTRVYGFAGNLIRPANLSIARFIGVRPGITVDRFYNSHFSSSVAYFRFFTGDFLQQTPPGRNIGYLDAIFTFRY